MVVVVGDGKWPQAEAMVLEFKDKLPVKYIEINGPSRDWGHTPRNMAMPLVRTRYVAHMDDDDIYAPDAIKTIRQALEHRPGVPHIFSVIFPDGLIIPRDQESVRYANVSTLGMVHPHQFRRYATWQSVHGGDCFFWQETMTHYPKDSLVWHKDIVAIVRPFENA